MLGKFIDNSIVVGLYHHIPYGPCVGPKRKKMQIRT